MHRVISGLLGALTLLAVTARPALADYDAAAAYSEGLRGVSMIVVVDGAIVFERYGNGQEPDDPHALASGTKSFAGIIAAAAVQDGLLDLDERVSDTITEWQGSDREAITVRQLLNMTDGLVRNVGRRLRRTGVTYERAIQFPLAAPPGTRFAYSPIPFQVFGELMRRKLDQDPVDYLTARIFEPIGMEVARWRDDRGGNSNMGAGARLTARDWARFGQFILARGYWNGEALVSPEAFNEIFVGSAANPAYGLSWWLNEPVDPAFAETTPPMDQASDIWVHRGYVPDDLVMAAGLGDQRLYVSWERNMVVVRQADGILGASLGNRLSWSDVEFWRRLDAPAGVTPPPLEDPPNVAGQLRPSVPEPAESEEEESDDDFVGPTF